MDQMKKYHDTQALIDKLTGTSQEERHSAQRKSYDYENRAQRRERERQERRAAAKHKAKVKA